MIAKLVLDGERQRRQVVGMDKKKPKKKNKRPAKPDVSQRALAAVEQVIGGKLA